MNALCIVVDGLRAGFLGCYGNAWVETPALDRLAAQGFVFDHALIDSPQLDDFYRGCWLGTHALSPRDGDHKLTPLPQALASAGIAAALVTDEEGLAAHPLAGALREIVQIPPARAVTAASSDQTQLAAAFSAAADWIQDSQEPFCLWLHAQGMHAVWDAPLALRERYAEEDDVPPPTFIAPPHYWLPAEHDPDQRLALRWAYAAQVTVLDRCLEGFLEWFDAQPAARQTMLVLIGARGYPLGEHARVGMAPMPPDRTSLHEELIHIPCLVRMPGHLGAADRSQALVQPADLAEALAEWFQLPGDRRPAGGRSWIPLIHDRPATTRDRACIAGNGSERAIRTAAWHLIVPAAAEAERKLYAKPDDRWELNEVANRCGDVADQLSAALEEFTVASQHGEPITLTPLADVLQQGMT